MNNQYFYTIITALILSLSSCSDIPKNVRQTLKLAGDNKVELQKVIEHYQAPKDSLKLKAAYFLIGNMSSHYYSKIESKQKWEQVLKTSDSLIEHKLPDYEKTMKEMFYNQGRIAMSNQLDIKTIKSKDLIENIELAFKVWPKPWNDFLDFEGFCNFILPYRVKNEPIDLGLREVYYNQNIHKLKNKNSVDDMKSTLGSLSSFANGSRFIKLITPDLGLKDIENGKMADCTDESNYVSFKGRSIGIPMAMDFTIWPNFKGSHYWPAILHDKDSLLAADGNFFWGTPEAFKLRRKVAKVYRYMYASQIPFSIDKEANTFLNNPNIMDVTAQYIETSNINIPFKKTINKYSKAYLCVFNGRKWKEIAVSNMINKKEVSFKNIGRGNVYLVSCFEKGRLIPVSDIFSVSDGGVIQFHKADKSKTQKVKLTRKTKKTKVKGFAKQMFETAFQLANTPDFKNAKTVYQIKQGDSVFIPRTVDINGTKKHRYARYRSALDKVARIAEMQWFSGDIKLEGEIIGDETTDYEKYGSNAMDNDLVSYFSTGKLKNGYSWVGLDFGKKQPITKLFFAPRSDVNYVKPNDVYELFYWDNEWVSLGTENAQEYFVEYNNVPGNAVLWLRNLNEGVEEQLFIMKGDAQEFWFSTPY